MDAALLSDLNLDQDWNYHGSVTLVVLAVYTEQAEHTELAVNTEQGPAGQHLHDCKYTERD